MKAAWFSKRLNKSSKTKAKYQILKDKSTESEEKYKNYKNLSKMLKTKIKENYFECLSSK